MHTFTSLVALVGELYRGARMVPSSFASPVERRTRTHSDVPLRLEMVMDNQSVEWRSRVRRQNDQFRCFGIGRGSIMLTAGVDDLGPAFVSAVVATVRTFDAFDRDNDPHHEHDFGAFTLEGHRLFFKIDYYDLDLTGGSPDPADPAVTHRILTVMLASEY